MRSISAVVIPSRMISRNSKRISATMRLAPFMRSISRGDFKLIIRCILTAHAIIPRGDWRNMAETKLAGKKVLMVIPHTQFRDEEFFQPKQILETEGAAVTVASTTVRTCHGTLGGTVQSQIAIADAK